MEAYYTIPTGRCAGAQEREQELYQDYLNRLRELEITNATGTDFKGWVVGFYGEQSKALAGVASMIADAQTAKWRCDLAK